MFNSIFSLLHSINIASLYSTDTECSCFNNAERKVDQRVGSLEHMPLAQLQHHLAHSSGGSRISRLGNSRGGYALLLFCKDLPKTA